MKRKFNNRVIVASCLVMMLAGCGQEAPSSSSSQQNKNNKQGSPVQIEFWYGYGGATGDSIVHLVDQFNQSQSEVKVNAVYQESTKIIGQKLLTAIVGNSVPDVVQLNARSWPTFAYNQALLPLDSYIQNDPEFDYSDFVDGLVDNTLIEGKTYTLPFNRSTMIFYYNKDIVRELGLDPEHPVSTWDELMAAAKKATVVKDGKTERFGYATVLPPLYYYSLMWSNGGDILGPDLKEVVVDQDPAIRGLEMYRKMIYDDKTMMQPMGGIRDGDQEVTNFINGKVAFLLASTGDLSTIQGGIDFELGTDFVPKFKENAVPSASGGNLAIVAKAPKEKQDAAWKFIKFLTDTQQTIQFSQHTGYMPIRKSAVEAPEMMEFYKKNPFFKTAVDQLPYGKGIPVVPNFEKIEAAIQKALEKTYAENVPAGESMKEAANQIRALLKK